jgi:hypothetical protein
MQRRGPKTGQCQQDVSMDEQMTGRRTRTRRTAEGGGLPLPLAIVGELGRRADLGGFFRPSG